MCYSAPVSWVAFVIGTIFNLFLMLIFRDNIMVVALALFLQFVVMVQFFEALTWTGHKQLGANAILILTLLQPVVLGLVLLYASPVGKDNIPLIGEANDTNYWKLIVGFVLVLYIGWAFYSLNNSPNFESLKPGSCGHLDYEFWRNIGSAPYFLVALFAAIILIKPVSLMVVFVATVVLTLVASLLFYGCRNETPSLWCLFSVLTPIVLFIYLLCTDTPKSFSW